MKNLTDILSRGNLTPKERMLLLVHNQAQKEKTGKETLSEADKYTIQEGWRPKNNYEVREFNRYLEGAELRDSMEIEIVVMYLYSQVSLLKHSRVLDHLIYTNHKIKNRLSELISVKNIESASCLLLKNSGLSYGEVINKLTFQNIEKDLRKEVLPLPQETEDIGKELLKKYWKEAEAKTISFIDDLVEKGKLEVIYKNDTKILTGESLYDLDEDLSFVKEYKEQLKHFELLGLIVIYLKEGGITDIYPHLISSLNIFKKLSEIYEIDLCDRINICIDDYKNDIEEINKNLIRLLNKLDDDLFINTTIDLPIHIFIDDMLFGFENTNDKTVYDDSIQYHTERFKKIFGESF